MSIFLENCFGCLRLRTGVLLIGYLNLAGALVLFIMHTIMIIRFYVSVNPSMGRDAFVNVMSLIQMLIFTIVLTIVSLVYGATQGKRHFMLPFVAVALLSSAHVVCYELLCCLFLVSQITSLTVSFFWLAVLLFFVYVILSHYQELKKLTRDNREDDEVSIVNSA